MSPLKQPIVTTLAEGSGMKSTQYGTAKNNNKTTTVLTYALYIPRIKHNLLSVYDLAKRYGVVKCTSKIANVSDTNGSQLRPIAKAKWNTSTLSYFMN